MNLDLWEEKARRMETLEVNDMRLLLKAASNILENESNVPSVSLPVTVCGDIHGQFPDLLHLINLSGQIGAGDMHYIFLGDFVDRGLHGVEVLTFLLIMKLKYPNHITLLRGNHETRQISRTYGFYDECSKKFHTTDVWRCCTELFDLLPITALVDGHILCVHGGLSPDVRSLDDARLLDRYCEVPGEGPITDLVWSDPGGVSGWAPSQRGAGRIFGKDVACEFMHRNGLTLIARAHQLVEKGFTYHFDEERVCTVWSAPNYCYRCKNLGSFIRIYEDHSRELVFFKQVEHQLEKPSIPTDTLKHFL
ncbi:putative Calcineurin like phosphoesterase [Trypanosoma vivax]|uniref:Serine/threonine-protein phosphatase n=1 Tax=Trypanosoma vivax (strain Y486) TaxID=1055687 RepID=G0TTT0_TRYVY|nr:putative serine/threonine phosphatase [Trypanosoma vivax]KAH8613737.1 putative Calcineurin like phosphoesterase [Trypanosoma vivax]CCC47361.1 putative serine/threonine phosphatase [Trypanosoma vivax Y486]